MFHRRTKDGAAARRRGFIAVLAALMLIPLIGMLALAIDGGMLMAERRKVQAAADAAALAAANSVSNDVFAGNKPDYTKAQSVADQIASSNGFAAGVQFNQPPTQGPHAGVSGYIEVIITYNQPRYFSAIWGSGTVPVWSRGVAQIGMPYSTAAILVLAPTGTSVTLSGSTKVNASGGSIVVDSTSSSSITTSSTASITTPELDLSGNISYSGSNPNHATTTKYAQTPTPDPLASVPVPSTTGLTVQSTSAIKLSGSQTETLNPGVYNGGISLSGSSSVTLNPGVYYINGGGISLSSSSGIVGNGVFIYNTGGGSISLTGTGTVSLSPMTTGTYAGLTLFQDRSSSATASLTGGSNTNLTGTFYFPDAALSMTGSSGTAVMGAQMISKTISFTGSAGVNVDYGSSVARKSTTAIVE